MTDLKTIPKIQDAAERLAAAETELAALRRELEHAQRLATLGTLAAGVAHEINNILTPVLAYAQLARKNADDADLQIKAIEKAVTGVEAATEITQSILGFSANSDQAELANIDEVLEAALECIGRQPRRDRIDLKINVQTDVWVQIRPLALQQVLMNLILNAWAALRGRGGEIAVSAMNRSDGRTIIRVTDTGPGIPSEIAGRLFEPFVRLQGASEKGTGLGLAICRRLIEAAQGTIDVASTPGRGSSFTITLSTARIQRAKAS